jgi:16S rRNA (cytosine1402-N4)-methyltransferase
VNDELKNLKNVLSDTLDILNTGGIVCVISFHSGEDRIVKQFIREKEQEQKKETDSNEEGNING